jgi:hypothetical protein
MGIPLPPRLSHAALRSAARGESARTILIAFLANVVSVVAKLVAGLVSRSAALLEERRDRRQESPEKALPAEPQRMGDIGRAARSVSIRAGAMPIACDGRGPAQQNEHHGFRRQPMPTFSSWRGTTTVSILRPTHTQRLRSPLLRHRHRKPGQRHGQGIGLAGCQRHPMATPPQKCLHSRGSVREEQAHMDAQ